MARSHGPADNSGADGNWAGPVEATPGVIHEQPCLQFRKYGIAFHYIVHAGRGFAKEELVADTGFGSLERDLMAHAFRDSGAMASSIIPDMPSVLVRVHFPQVMQYQAEGENRKLHVASGNGHGRTRLVSMKFTQSTFRSGHIVYHVALTPVADDPEDSELNEYDVVKLVKMWEGGESVGPGQVHDIRRQVGFSMNNQQPVSLEHLLNHVLGNRLPRHLTPADLLTGTVQIEALGSMFEGDWRRVVRAIREELQPATLRDQSDPQANAIRAEAQLKAFAGVLQGVLDFPFIEWRELMDAYRPTLVEEGMCPTLMGIHKGTLLYCTTGCRLLQLEVVKHAIGVNPYLLIPHAVLTYNEQLLREALAISSGASINRRDLVGTENRLQQAELALRDIVQQHWLPNIFHYDTERHIYDYGHRSRGLNIQRESLQERLKNVNAQLDETRAILERLFQRRVGRYGLFLALVALPLTIFQSLADWDEVVLLAQTHQFEAFAAIIGGVLILSVLWFLPGTRTQK